MKLLVSGEIKFKKLTQDPTKSRGGSSISYLCKLKDEIIDDGTFRKILPCGSTSGVLYGPPEVPINLVVLFVRLFLL